MPVEICLTIATHLAVLFLSIVKSTVSEDTVEGAGQCTMLVFKKKDQAVSCMDATKWTLHIVLLVHTVRDRCADHY